MRPVPTRNNDRHDSTVAMANSFFDSGALQSVFARFEEDVIAVGNEAVRACPVAGGIPEEEAAQTPHPRKKGLVAHRLRAVVGHPSVIVVAIRSADDPVHVLLGARQRKISVWNLSRLHEPIARACCPYEGLTVAGYAEPDLCKVKVDLLKVVDSGLTRVDVQRDAFRSRCKQLSVVPGGRFWFAGETKGHEIDVIDKASQVVKFNVLQERARWGKRGGDGVAVALRQDAARGSKQFDEVLALPIIFRIDPRDCACVNRGGQSE